MSRESDTRELATKTVNRFGRIDVLVNNAAIYGTLKRRPFMEIPVEEWDPVMAVNLRGLFLCARAVFPAVKAQGKGKIINVAAEGFAEAQEVGSLTLKGLSRPVRTFNIGGLK